MSERWRCGLATRMRSTTWGWHTPRRAKLTRPSSCKAWLHLQYCLADLPRSECFARLFGTFCREQFDVLQDGVMPS